MDYSKLSIVMCSLNEEEAIKKVINGINKVTKGKAEVVVVDSSTDRTAEIAKKLGAVVIKQPKMGYGLAMRTGFKKAKGSIVITVDCDDTYPAEQIPEFISLIEAGYDVVSGSRMSKRSKNMPFFNYFGNFIFALLVRILYGIKTDDVSTGMRAYKKKVLDSVEWETNLALPAELAIRPVLYGYKFKEIPINYKPRLGERTINIVKVSKAFLACIFKYRFKKT